MVLLTLTLLTRNIKFLKFSTFLLRKVSYLLFIQVVYLTAAAIYFVVLQCRDSYLLCAFISGTIFICFTLYCFPLFFLCLKTNFNNAIRLYSVSYPCMHITIVMNDLTLKPETVRWWCTCLLQLKGWFPLLDLGLIGSTRLIFMH